MIQQIENIVYIELKIINEYHIILIFIIYKY